MFENKMWLVAIVLALVLLAGGFAASDPYVKGATFTGTAVIMMGLFMSAQTEHIRAQRATSKPGKLTAGLGWPTGTTNGRKGNPLVDVLHRGASGTRKTRQRASQAGNTRQYQQRGRGSTTSAKKGSGNGKGRRRNTGNSRGQSMVVPVYVPQVQPSLSYGYGNGIPYGNTLPDGNYSVYVSPAQSVPVAQPNYGYGNGQDITGRKNYPQVPLPLPTVEALPKNLHRFVPADNERFRKLDKLKERIQ